MPGSRPPVVACLVSLLSISFGVSAFGQLPGNRGVPRPEEGGSIVAWGKCGFDPCVLPSPNTRIKEVVSGKGQIYALTFDGTILASCPPPSNSRCVIPEPNSDFVGVAAGWFHGLGLKNDGSVVAWGLNSFGQIDVPSPNSDFVAIAASKYQSLALKRDGHVVAWGCGDPDADFGQCDEPSPNEDFVAISAGLFHNLALKNDGSVVAWGCQGAEDFGQCDVPSTNTGFVAIGAGFWQSVALKVDGSVAVWGHCGPSPYVDSEGCALPEPNERFVAIAVGGEHTIALRADGSAQAWGQDFDGQATPPTPNRGFHAVSAGGHASFAISNDCNENTIPDNLEFSEGISSDCDANGVADECELTAAVDDLSEPAKNRYLSFFPGNAGRRTGFHISLLSTNHPNFSEGEQVFDPAQGMSWWVGPPALFDDPTLPGASFVAATLQCEPYFRDWGDVQSLWVYGDGIVPDSTFEVRTVLEGCGTLDPQSVVIQMPTKTARWGDVVEPFEDSSTLAQPDLRDISTVVDKFSGAGVTISRPRAQLTAKIDPRSSITFMDIAACVDAFAGVPYSNQFDPSPCP